jgi:LytS/YehU family sensor histidine kinase
LCLKDRAESAEAIIKLSDLLRYVVYQGNRDWVGLDEEIAYLRNYLDLQLLRFGQRCRIACDWPDDSARSNIPPLLLIMLVENAFKHGVEPCEGESTIKIALGLDGARMHFTCRNEPYDLVASATGGGVGLANLRRRLEILFGDDFMLSSAPEGDGWKAALSLDLQPC